MHQSLINFVLAHWHRVPGGATLPTGTEYVQVYSDGTAGEYVAFSPEAIHEPVLVYTEQKISAPLPTTPGTVIYNVRGGEDNALLPQMTLTRSGTFLTVSAVGVVHSWHPSVITSFDLNPS